MEYEINKQNIQMNQLAVNTLVEQSVELDYMLPDYCADVFKVLKVEMKPHILSEHISANKLLIDGVTEIKVIYLGWEGNQMNCIEQKQAFSKTVDLKEDCSDGYAMVRTKCDYVNCRAESSRRLDIKGAVTLMISVYKNRSIDAVCGCSELQIHKKSIVSCNRMSYVSKEFTVREELQIGGGKPPIAKVLSYTAEAEFTDYKILANKVICKGEILLHTLYLDENLSAPEVMEHSIALSQIMDCDGVDEDYICHCRFDVVKYDIDLQMDGSGKCVSFVAEIGIRAYCETAYNQQIDIIDDCYSTICEVQNTIEKHEVEQIDRIINQNSMQRHTIKHNQSDVSLIYDLKCEASNSSVKMDGTKLMLLSNLQVSAIASDNQGIAMSVDQNVPCEIELCDLGYETPISFTPTISVVSCAYNIVSTNEIELRVELKIRGILYRKHQIHFITEVVLDETQIKQRKDDAALRLYFADEGENIWSIAKRYNTSVSAILENNVIEDETLSARGMIFIPIVD